MVTRGSDWLGRLAGRFIVFDGPDGSGKSTQFARFAEHCRSHCVPIREVREPGGTEIGEQIRRILLDPANTGMTLRCEMLLYMASRAQLVQQMIQPALARGEFVLADRFLSSTLAYQGSAGGLSESEILAVGDVTVGSCRPDLTVLFDVDPQLAARRMTGKPKDARRTSANSPGLFEDRMEQKDIDFHARVRQGFLDQAARDPDRHLVIDTAAQIDAVFQSLLAGVQQRLDRM